MNVALLGCGTVGGGVRDIIDGGVADLHVTKILTLPGELDDPRCVNDIADVVDDPEVDAVVEAMGGIEPARTFILRALEAGKGVVSANKAVVAQCLPEFVAAASASSAPLFVEATSGGGIPWIASLIKVRRIDAISAISGIVNGTANYIVDSMGRESLSFEAALAQAQNLGYAEADPSADIDGFDTRNKALISSTVAFGTLCEPTIPTHGIRNLTKADLDAFAELGYGVRLMMKAACDGSSYAVATEPVLMPLATLEANVPGNFNMATLVGDTVGPLKFYGQGAGALPTGNAMVQDLIDMAAGVKPVYATEQTLTWDSSKLKADYVFRTWADINRRWTDFGDTLVHAAFPGYKLVKGLTADEASAMADEMLERDSATFFASIATPEML